MDTEDKTNTTQDWGRLHSLGMLGLFILMATCFYIYGLEAVPCYENMFDGMGIELPWITYQLLNGTFYFPLYILIAFALLKECLIKNRLLSCTINWFLIWTIPVYVYFFFKATFEPMFIIIQGM